MHRRQAQLLVRANVALWLLYCRCIWASAISLILAGTKGARYMKKIGRLAVVILVACLSLTGCANYVISKSQTPPSQTTTPTLSSISITASTNTVNAGSSLQLTAKGKYSDNSTATLTTQVAWNSSDSTIASVNALGVLTAFKAGAV